MIYGSRVRYVRQFLGQTQGHFAEAVGWHQSQVSAAETKAQVDVPEAILVAMAEHTGFPTAYFECGPLPPIEDVQFRARLTVKAVDRNRVVACAAIVHQSYTLMRTMLEATEVTFPRMEGVNPESAARHFRSHLALPEGPISNLTLPVERQGLALLTLPVTGKKNDAFSWWQADDAGAYPVLVTLAGTPGDRLRWNIAHEIGHLLLHSTRQLGVAGREVEAEADAFAAELLTPLRTIAAEMPRAPKLSSLYAMKVRWGVSVQSLVRRAHDLHRVDEGQYMSLFKQISARGERMNERFQIEREKPRTYRKMAEVLYGESPAAGLSTLCSWTPAFTEDVLDQFATKAELPSRRVLVPAHQNEDNVIQLHRPQRTST